MSGLSSAAGDPPDVAGSPGGVVDARAPGGGEIRIRVAESAPGLGSVGLERVDLEAALGSIGEVAGLVRDKLEGLAPSRAKVEFGVAFSMKTGRLTALLFESGGNASLTVSLEWETSSTAATDTRPTDGPSPD